MFGFRKPSKATSVGTPEPYPVDGTVSSGAPKPVEAPHDDVKKVLEEAVMRAITSVASARAAAVEWTCSPQRCPGVR